MERLYQIRDIRNYELSLPLDIPSIKRQAEEFAAIHIWRYHRLLGKMLQEITPAGEFLREIQAVPTIESRSYFRPLADTLAIGIPFICYIAEDGSLHIRERELVTLYGHEGMGHALNKVVTKSSNLPFFLTKDSLLTMATEESVAQHYQVIIFDDLKRSPETQKDLGVRHIFDDLYQETKDIDQLERYKAKLFQYSITVLADKELGDPQAAGTVKKKVEAIQEVTLNPSYPMDIVEQNRYNFDSQGNLNPRLVSELRYCAQPVQRALKEFVKQGIIYEGEGRSKIDLALLNGFWTPLGFVDNSRLKAKEK